MANFNNIKHEIDQNVNTNGQQAITGAILNTTLKDMLDEVNDKKQDTLVAGQNITISGNVISATGGGSGSEYHEGPGIKLEQNVISVDTNFGLYVDGNNQLNVDPATVQSKLFPGQNITISGSNYISATDTTYSAGSGLNLNGTTFSADTSVLQPKLTAGSGISISAQNVISATGGGGGGTTYGDGDAIHIDSNDNINVLYGNGLQLDGNGALEVDTAQVASDLAGSGLTTNNGQLEVDPFGMPFLPLAGGQLQDDPNNTDSTDLNITSPSGDSNIDIYTEDSPDPVAYIQVNDGGGSAVYGSTGISDGTYTMAFPSLSNNEVIAVQSDIPTASDLAGAGLTVDQNGALEVDPSSITGFLPLTGGTLQDSSVGTELVVKSPDNDTWLSVGANDSGVPRIIFTDTLTNPSNGDIKELKISTDRIDITAYNQSSGNWRGDSLFYPELKSGTIALDSDLAGKQDTLVSGTNIKTINGNSLLGNGDLTISGGQSYTAGNGIDITSGTISVDATDLDGSGLSVDVNGALQVDTTTIQEKLVSGTNIKTINNQSLLGSGNISISGGGGNYLPLDGGTLENTAVGANSTQLTIDSPSNLSSAILVSTVDASNNGEASIQLRGDVYGSNYPYRTYLKNDGLYIGRDYDNNGVHSWRAAVRANAQGEIDAYSPLYNAHAELRNQDLDPGNTRESSSTLKLSDYDSLDDHYYAIYGSKGITWYDGSTATSDAIDFKDIATIPNMSNYFLPLDGGTLSNAVAGDITNLDVVSPLQNASVSVSAEDLDPGNTAESMAKITLSDYDSSSNAHEAIYTSTGISDGTYTISFPTLSANDTFALASQISGGSGLWTSGTGTNSVMSPGAWQANGSNSISAGDNTRANGASSVALGSSTTASGYISTAIGAGASAAGPNSVAIGNTVGAPNDDELALGKFNNYISSGTTSEKTFFTIGNGTGVNDKSNLIEAKQNNDIYVVGVGGFTGANASNASTLQTVLSGKQDALTAGNGIDITSGTISVDETYLDSVYLPIIGGSLENTSNHTDLRVDAPNSESDNFVDILSPGTGVPSVELGTDTNTQGEVESLKFKGDADIDIKYVGDNTTYTLSFPTLTQNETIATLSDISGSGTQYTAGSGISISAQNVISNSAPSLWIAGSGTSAMKNSSFLSTANGAYAVGIGQYNHADGSDSLAAGQWANASAQSAIALGDNSGASASYAAGLGYFAISSGQAAVAIGCNSQAKNENEIGIGKYNNSINSGTTAEKTQFTVGAGTASNARANLIEAKQNKDIYVYGVGGFDGTNAGASGVQTLQYAIANAGGGGGSSLWSSGTGTDSLVAPATITASLSVDPAPGTGAISCGYDTDANGDYSFACGGASEANGDYTFVANNGTTNADYAAAFGTSGANGYMTFAAGDGSVADATKSIALAGGNTVYDDTDPDNIIDAEGSVAIGGWSSGPGCVVLLGEADTTADSSVSVGGIVNGTNCLAGFGGHAFGQDSFANGLESYSYPNSSIALGSNILTYDQADPSDPDDPNAGETALGRWNYTEAGQVFSVGCGYYDPEMGEEHRMNAIAIDSNGNIFIKGLGGYTGTSTSGCTSLQTLLANV